MPKQYEMVIKDASESDPDRHGKLLEIRDIDSGLPVASIPVQDAAEILLKSAFLRFIQAVNHQSST